MAIPTYDQFIEPLLRHLAKHPDGVRSGDIYGVLADQVGLTESERLERLPSRMQPVHHNRVGWAHDRLKRAGYSTSAKRGTWKITDAGLQFVRENPRPLSAEQIERLAYVPSGSRLRPELP